MTNGFVQQDPGPAGAEHYRHLARRRGTRLKADQRLAQGFVGDRFGASFGQEVLVAAATATTVTGGFAATLMLDDDRDIEPD